MSPSRYVARVKVGRWPLLAARAASAALAVLNRAPLPRLGREVVACVAGRLLEELRERLVRSVDFAFERTNGPVDGAEVVP